MSKIAALLVTVEGVLLGLSPLLFEKFGKWSGVVSITLTAFAALWSLSVLVVADTAPTGLAPIIVVNYTFDLFLFGLVVLFYVVSAWEAVLRKKIVSDFPTSGKIFAHSA